MAEPISQNTSIQIGLVILLAGPLLWGAVQIEKLSDRVQAMQVDTQKIPSMELEISHIRRDVAELAEENNSTQNFKRRHMARVCREMEALNKDPNAPFECPDVYKDTGQ